MTDPCTLHYAPDNASLIVRLTLEEMGLSYRTALVDRSVEAQRSPAYLKLNPNGLIPVLETRHGAMFETGAILLWLADTHGQMAPAPDHPDRGDFLKWLFFLSNTLHADLRISFYTSLYAGEDPATQRTVRATVCDRLCRHLAALDRLAATRPSYFGSETPSVLDYYIACAMRWMALYPAALPRDWFTLSATPQLQRILTALEPRPAVAAAIRAEGLGPRPFTAPRHPEPPEGSAT